MVNNMTQDNNLAAAVIQLHDIARLLETEIGQGKLSEDLRNCADRLHALTQYSIQAEKAE
jgi:hypothetical protein